MEIAGVDTIQGFTGKAPDKVEVSYDTIKAAELLKQLWNSKHLAFIPYCISCKVPLNWIINPPEEVMFRCPQCKREWIRNKQWQEASAKDSKK